MFARPIVPGSGRLVASGPLKEVVMSAPRKRVWSQLVLVALAIPLTATAMAYACTGLATVTSSTSAAAPGTKVTVSGASFAAHDPADTRTEPAIIRFDSLTGPVVATASPTGSADGGRFSVELTVPALAAGNHVLVVTQNGIDGRPAYGTPARQAFTVLAPVPPPPPPPAAAAAPIEIPILSRPFMTPPPPSAESVLRSALSRCRRLHNPSKAKTKAGKRRLSKRRAACMTSAQKRLG